MNRLVGSGRGRHRLWISRLPHSLGLALVLNWQPGASAQTAIAPHQSKSVPTALDSSLESSLDSSLSPSLDAPLDTSPDAPPDGSPDASPDPMEQVTSVSQLADLRPTDWGYQALQSLVERYGCINGYPDKSFRGNRAMTRYEFAAGLNACMERIGELIAASTDLAAKQQDLDQLRQLQTEFRSELDQLQGRVDSLEARTQTLERQQFSTTTKLNGFVSIGLQQRFDNRADVAPRDGIKDTDDPGTQAHVIAHSYLGLTTFFSPQSFLYTGLWQQKGTATPRLNNDGRLGYDFTDFNLTLSELKYHFMVGNKFAAVVGTEGVYAGGMLRGPNRQEGIISGPLSYFAQRNPIINIGFTKGGAGFDWQFAKRASLQAFYTTNIPGFFQNGNSAKGHNTGGLQLALTPTDRLDLTLYYINDYSPDGMLLGLVGDDLLVAPTTFVPGRNIPLQTNAYGLSANWQLNAKLTLGGWFGYTHSTSPGRSGQVETTNYMVYLNFLDLFGKGNVGGLYVGQPPKITSSTLPVGLNLPDFLNTGQGRAGGQPGTSTHVEAFYRWQITPNISVTPGVMVIFNPGHTPDSDPVTVGAVRTTFTF